MKLQIATCQFPISADISRNSYYIQRQIKEASLKGADVVHFPEACLSGYADIDFKSHKGFNWKLLKQEAEEVLECAGKFNVWVILGSAHKLTGSHKPHNSLYIINNQGKLVDRYDKMFCAGNKSCTKGDLAHYTSGNHFTVFNIKGIKCGAIICHDYRYPELYREYKRRGVQVMFHSYHAGNAQGARLRQMKSQIEPAFRKLSRGSTYPEITMPATMIAYAASSHVWISCANTSAPESCWPSFFVRADGVITGKLRRNVRGVLISTVDTKQAIYESTAAWRENALKGILHSGHLVKDKRSTSRKVL